MTITELARAKVNLTLHVGSPESDGYHPLESVVMFADIGDVLTARPAVDFRLDISGPFAAGLSAGDDNLILRAANLARKYYDVSFAAFTLEKRLPVASGIGGGSADAAAAMRLLARLEGLSEFAFQSIASDLGADVPVCLRSESSFMSGYGEELSVLEPDAQIPAVLVNPRLELSTGRVFKAYDKSIVGQTLAIDHSDGGFMDMVKNGRNDLQPSACQIAPPIEEVLSALSEQKGALLSRMSGSGATCFAIFETQNLANSAAKALSEKHPHWWVSPTVLGEAD